MISKISVGQSGRTRAIVHVPRDTQQGEVIPVRAVERTVKESSRAVRSGGRSTRRYRSAGDVYASEIPAIVIDVLR